MQELITDLNPATLFTGKTTSKVIVKIKPFDNCKKADHYVKLLNGGADYTTVHTKADATMFDSIEQAEQFVFANDFFVEKKN